MSPCHPQRKIPQRLAWRCRSLHGSAPVCLLSSTSYHSCMNSLCSSCIHALVVAWLYRALSVLCLSECHVSATPPVGGHLGKLQAVKFSYRILYIELTTVMSNLLLNYLCQPMVNGANLMPTIILSLGCDGGDFIQSKQINCGAAQPWDSSVVL